MKLRTDLVYFDDTEDIGISRRTILRDLKEIRSVMGISIEYSRSENGYYIPDDEDQISDIERIIGTIRPYYFSPCQGRTVFNRLSGKEEATWY